MINLSKNQKISLHKKNNKELENFCVGVNWGKIKTKGFFGFGSSTQNVDLDASCVLLDKDNSEISKVWYRNLSTNGIKHSGDDRVGDDENDGLDNEIISIDLTKIDKKCENIVFFINSFSGQKFDAIPYSSIRLYEGTPKKVVEIVGTFELSNDNSFQGKTSMIMGRLFKDNGSWKFESLGIPSSTRTIEETIKEIKTYLNNRS